MNKPLLMLGIEEAPLPRQVVTKTGGRFDPNLDHWNYRDAASTISFDFSFIRKVAPHLIDSIKRTLVWYAENKSASHLKNMFSLLQHFLGNVLVTEAITEVTVLNYRAFLPPEKSWYLGSLAGFLKRWNSFGYPGVTESAAMLLDSLSLKGNVKGKAVLTMDPVNGPYSGIEYEAIQAALNESYANGGVDLEGYALVWLFMLLGQRPSQYALLKVCDVIAPQPEAKSPSYILRIPRVKQRGVLPRRDFKERLLTPQIGRLLVRYAALCKQNFEGRMSDPSQAPLFPERKNRFPQPESLAYHRTSLSLSMFLNSILKGLEVYSERTGCSFARRFDPI